MMNKTEGRGLELYIHIPFCVRKCLYCDFLSFAAGAEVRELYTNRLTEEIKAAGERYPGRQAVSLFLGGGTPSLLLPDQTGRILSAAKAAFCWAEDPEVTTEANPGTLDRDKLLAYRSLGINRLSLGLQSADGEELKALGRIHSFEDFLAGYELAREEGFTNINVDLMSALPGQTEASWRKTLEAVTALSPEHISAYSLIIEEGTPFFERYGQLSEEPEDKPTGKLTGKPEDKPSGKLAGKLAGEPEYSCLPGEEQERRMYHETKLFLKHKGYERYEISNYAKPGRECRHNVGYWTGTEYLGLGLGASSYVEGERFFNETDLKTYLNTAPEEFRLGIHQKERRRLTRREQMEEFMFLGLRLIKGISKQAFYDRFGISVEEVYADQLEALTAGGLLGYEPCGGRFFLTDYGIDVSNRVLSHFLID